MRDGPIPYRLRHIELTTGAEKAGKLQCEDRIRLAGENPVLKGPRRIERAKADGKDRGSIVGIEV